MYPYLIMSISLKKSTLRNINLDNIDPLGLMNKRGCKVFQGDVNRLNRLIQKIKHSGIFELFFPNLGDIAYWVIVNSSDASLANCAVGSAQEGILFFFVRRSIFMRQFASGSHGSYTALFVVLHQHRQGHVLKELTLTSYFQLIN